MPHDLRYPQHFEARYGTQLGAVEDFASDLSQPLLLVLFLSLKTFCFLSQAFLQQQTVG